MASVPRVRSVRAPLAVGLNGASKLWNYRIDALLASQPHHKLKNGKWSGGGEFYQVSTSALHNSLSITWKYNGSPWNGAAAGVGNLSSGAGSPVTTAGGPNVSSIVNSFGNITDQRESPTTKYDFSVGWERTRPGNPEASLAQFIAELREFPLVPGYQVAKASLGRVKPRRLKKARPSFYRDWVSGPIEQIPWKLQMQMGFFKSIGSEYLNHVFGWAPFVQDLQKLYVLSQTIDNRIKQLANHNGKGMRRKASVGNDRESSTVIKVLPTAPFYGALFAPPNWPPSGGSTWTSTSVTERKSWFSAKYRYYIPDVGSGGWIPGAKRALAGANITPSLVWELTPWSWLLDWFGNVGTVLSNFSENAVENLVADYSFLMINVKQTTTCTSTGSYTSRNTPPGPLESRIGGGSHNLTSVYKSETKVRVLGSPYGLGFKFSSLNGRQLGVLAALGITKSSF